MADKNEWLPVPSLNYRYEVDPRGRLRNAKTKKCLRASARGAYHAYCVSVCGKKMSVSVKSLLWEVHGIVPKKRRNKIPVTIKKGTDALYFESLKKAAKYLATLIHYSSGQIVTFFAKRSADICGWQITYHLPDDLSQVEYKGLRIKKHNR